MRCKHFKKKIEMKSTSTGENETLQKTKRYKNILFLTKSWMSVLSFMLSRKLVWLLDGEVESVSRRVLPWLLADLIFYKKNSLL